MFLIRLLSLAMFSPIAIDFESQIAQRIARLELCLEYHESHPYFKEYIKKNNCSPAIP